MSDRSRSIVEEHGGWASFLDWCDKTSTSFADLDITDEEWAVLHFENRDFTRPCIAYLGKGECGRCVEGRHLVAGEYGMPRCRRG